MFISENSYFGKQGSNSPRKHFLIIFEKTATTYMNHVSCVIDLYHHGRRGRRKCRSTRLLFVHSCDNFHYKLVYLLLRNVENNYNFYLYSKNRRMKKTSLLLLLNFNQLENGNGSRNVFQPFSLADLTADGTNQKLLF